MFREAKSSRVFHEYICVCACVCFPRQLFGLAAIAFGVLLTVVHEDLDYVTGSDVYSGAVVGVTAGVAIVIVAVFGIVAGWSEMWQLLTFVSKHVHVNRFLLGLS